MIAVDVVDGTEELGLVCRSRLSLVFTMKPLMMMIYDAHFYCKRV